MIEQETAARIAVAAHLRVVLLLRVRDDDRRVERGLVGQDLGALPHRENAGLKREKVTLQ